MIMKDMHKIMFDILDNYEKMSLDELDSHIANTMQAPLCKLLTAVNDEVMEIIAVNNDSATDGYPYLNYRFIYNTPVSRANYIQLPSLQLYRSAGADILSSNHTISDTRGGFLKRNLICMSDDHLGYNLQASLIEPIENFPDVLDEEYPCAA